VPNTQIGLMSEKKSFQVEFVIRSSPSILYNFLTTPAGLAQWFAEHVDKSKEDVYSFFWEGYEEQAELVDTEEDLFVRYQWLEADSNEFFEFRIEKVDVTNDTVLVITDFIEDYDLENQTRWWESQIANLKIRIGG